MSRQPLVCVFGWFEEEAFCIHGFNLQLRRLFPNQRERKDCKYTKTQFHWCYILFCRDIDFSFCCWFFWMWLVVWIGLLLFFQSSVAVTIIFVFVFILLLIMNWMCYCILLIICETVPNVVIFISYPGSHSASELCILISTAHVIVRYGVAFLPSL